MADLNTLVISRIPALTAKERLLLAELFPDSDSLLTLTAHDIFEIIGRKPRVSLFSMHETAAEAERIKAAAEKNRIRIIWYWDSGYPPQLREIFDPPVVLYAKGGSMENSLPHIAVVGTRHPGRKGMESAYMLGAGLAEKGIPVVSGLALGIDSAAHTGVVDKRGKTIAVLGNGIDSVYPVSNRKLAYGILENNGVLLSEFPPGTPPLKYNFPKRNRIISGLSRSVIIVEAPLKSGALITADFALEQGRDLFVHGCSLSSPGNEGALKLSFDGAGIVESPEDILKYTGSSSAGSLQILETPEDYTLSDLLAMELEGSLVLYEGTRFVAEGALS